jgi:hypothetical protein
MSWRTILYRTDDDDEHAPEQIKRLLQKPKNWDWLMLVGFIIPSDQIRAAPFHIICLEHRFRNLKAIVDYLVNNPHNTNFDKFITLLTFKHDKNYESRVREGATAMELVLSPPVRVEYVNQFLHTMAEGLRLLEQQCITQWKVIDDTTRTARPPSPRALHVWKDLIQTHASKVQYYHVHGIIQATMLLCNGMKQDERAMEIQQLLRSFPLFNVKLYGSVYQGFTVVKVVKIGAEQLQQMADISSRISLAEEWMFHMRSCEMTPFHILAYNAERAMIRGNRFNSRDVQRNVSSLLNIHMSMYAEDAREQALADLEEVLVMVCNNGTFLEAREVDLDIWYIVSRFQKRALNVRGMCRHLKPSVYAAPRVGEQGLRSIRLWGRREFRWRVQKIQCFRRKMLAQMTK